MEVGCYTLDLYCDNLEAGTCRDPDTAGQSNLWQYTGETRGQCRKQARRAGWVWHRNKTQTCPHCNGASIESS